MKKMVCVLVFVLLALSLFGCGSSSASAQKTVDQIQAEQARERLETAIATCDELQETDYTPYSWKKFTAALDNAKRVDGLETSRKSELDEVSKKLDNAKQDLRPSIESGKYQGLDYEACIRNPEQWKGKYIGFAGIVNEVKTDGGSKVLTVAMNGSNDTLVAVSYPSDLVEQNVLTGDALAIFGSVYTVKDGKTVAGTSITYPVIAASYIENESV